jgi:hypothetical protein
VRNLLDVNIKKYSGWQIDGPGMHQIAFEENFKPVSASVIARTTPAAFLISVINSSPVGSCAMRDSAIRQQGLGGSNRFSR